MNEIGAALVKPLQYTIVILFSLSILMIGGGFVAMHGGVAMDLDVPGSWLIPYVPGLSVMIYFVVVILIRRDKNLWRRLAFFIAVTMLCSTIIHYPVWIYNRSVHRIIFQDEPSDGLQSSFEDHFQVKTSRYGNSSEGEVLAVSNDDFTPEMLSYIKQAEQVGAPNPLPAE